MPAAQQPCQTIFKNTPSPSMPAAASVGAQLIRCKSQTMHCLVKPPTEDKQPHHTNTNAGQQPQPKRRLTNWKQLQIPALALTVRGRGLACSVPCSVLADACPTSSKSNHAQALILVVCNSNKSTTRTHVASQQASLLHDLFEGHPHLRWRLADGHPSCLQCRNLVGRLALASADDGSGMAHAATRWGG